MLELQWSEAKNEATLDELITYLRPRALWIPNYRERRIEQRYIRSGQVEKANDLIVARRQRIGGCNGARPQVMH
ncbi:MAG: hypothetical protein NVS2B7_38730 [Herpetosiphon sp.]